MFEYEPQNKKEPVDYTGLKIGAALIPVFFLVSYLTNDDAALTSCVVLGVVMLAVKLRWYLRMHAWFWMTVLIVLSLNAPLILIMRWPHKNVPTLFFTMPIGIVDFLVALGAISIAEKLFAKSDSPDEAQMHTGDME